MNNAKNEFRVDLAGNPDVREMLSGKKPGDSVEVTVRGKVKELNLDGDAVIAIDKLICDYEDETGEPKEAYPADEAPMRMEIRPPVERE